MYTIVHPIPPRGSRHKWYVRCDVDGLYVHEGTSFKEASEFIMGKKQTRNRTELLQRKAA
jgi:hypothetical protein